jgi:outer membrane protein assembly factor BamB
MNNRSMKISIILVWAVLASVLARAENWPQFRGPTGQGIATETGLPLFWSTTSNIVWKTPLPGESWSSPIVWGDRVFVTTATEGGKSLRLISVERQTGRIVWDQEVMQQNPIRHDDGNTFATPTPVTDGERVYVVSFNGAVAAVDYSGAIIWTNLGTQFYLKHGLASSPIVHGDLIVMNCDGTSTGPDPMVGWQKAWDGSYVLALDKTTGKVRWKTGRGLSRVAFSTPIVARVNGQEQVVSTAGDVVQGFDLKTGERIWTATNRGEGLVPSPVVGEGLVFSPSSFNTGTPDIPIAIRAWRLGGRGDVSKTHLVWEQTKEVSKIPSFVYSAPYLFTLTENGMVQCLQGATGAIVWKQKLNGRFGASPVLAEKRIYFLSENGETTVLEAGAQFKVVAKNPLDEKCQASMAVSKKQLFIRGEKHLYGIRKGILD